MGRKSGPPARRRKSFSGWWLPCRWNSRLFEEFEAGFEILQHLPVLGKFRLVFPDQPQVSRVDDAPAVRIQGQVLPVLDEPDQLFLGCDLGFQLLRLGG